MVKEIKVNIDALKKIWCLLDNAWGETENECVDYARDNLMCLIDKDYSTGYQTNPKHPYDIFVENNMDNWDGARWDKELNMWELNN